MRPRFGRWFFCFFPKTYDFLLPGKPRKVRFFVRQRVLLVLGVKLMEINSNGCFPGRGVSTAGSDRGSIVSGLKSSPGHREVQPKLVGGFNPSEKY